jgi:hypothetical protein
VDGEHCGDSRTLTIFSATRLNSETISNYPESLGPVDRQLYETKMQSGRPSTASFSTRQGE